MSEEIAIEGVTDEDTGTRRLDLWKGDPASMGVSPEESHGIGYSSRYLSDQDGAGLCAEVVIYPIEVGENDWGVQQMVTIGPAVFENDAWRPGDTADIDYDWADVRVFQTLESAQDVCDELGVEDWSGYLYLRGKL